MASSHVRRYDTTPDDYIDRAEFRTGLAALGLNFTADSLNLNEAQRAEVEDFLFSGPDAVVALEVRCCTAGARVCCALQSLGCVLHECAFGKL